MRNVDHTSCNPKEYILRAVIIPCFFLAFGAFEAALMVLVVNLIIAFVLHKRKQQIIKDREIRRMMTQRLGINQPYPWREIYSEEKIHDYLRSDKPADVFFHPNRKW